MRTLIDKVLTPLAAIFVLVTVATGAYVQFLLPRWQNYEQTGCYVTDAMVHFVECRERGGPATGPKDAGLAFVLTAAWWMTWAFPMMPWLLFEPLGAALLVAWLLSLLILLRFAWMKVRPA